MKRIKSRELATQRVMKPKKPSESPEIRGWTKVLAGLTNLRNELLVESKKQDAALQEYQTGVDGRFRRIEEKITHLHERIDKVRDAFLRELDEDKKHRLDVNQL